MPVLKLSLIQIETKTQTLNIITVQQITTIIIIILDTNRILIINGNALNRHLAII
jgi:hypothetical protein